MKFTGSSTLAALSVLRLVSANFDLYGGLIEYALPGRNTTLREDAWMVFEAEPDCNTANRAFTWCDRHDVSGDEMGVSYSKPVDAVNISPDRVEMNFHNTGPVYHFTIFKDRNYDMIGLDGNVYGNCFPFAGDQFSCNSTLPIGDKVLSGVRLFRCITDMTTQQLNHVNRKKVAINF